MRNGKRRPPQLESGSGEGTDRAIKTAYQPELQSIAELDRLIERLSEIPGTKGSVAPPTARR